MKKDGNNYDSLAFYRSFYRSIKLPILSKEEELLLFKKIKQGNEREKKEAKDKMILSNLGIVMLVINKVVKFPCSSLEFQDLVTEGILGLNKAMEKFDYNRNSHNRFYSYAWWWVFQKIALALLNLAPIIKISGYIAEEVRIYKKIDQELLQLLKREASPEEIAEKMEVSIKKIEKILLASKITPLSSLDEPIGEGDHWDHDTIGDLIPSKDKSPEKITEERELQKKINKLFGVLTPKEEQVVRRHFGVGKPKNETLEEIGQDFNVTRESIRQIEAKALKKLRRRAKKSHLQNFL